MQPHDLPDVTEEPAPACRGVVPSLFFIQFVLLLALQGGRSVGALSLYQLLSLFLFMYAHRDQKLPQTKIDLPIALFLTLSLISAVYSFSIARKGVVEFFTILAHFLNFYTVSRTFADRDHALFQSSIVLASLIFGFVFLLRPITAFFPNANLIASFFSCGFLILLSKALFDSSNRKLLSAGGSALVFVAVLLTGSRGALAAILFSLIFLMLLDWKKTLVPFGYLCAFVFALFLLAPHSLQLVLTSKVAFVLENTRLLIWKGAFLSFLDKPLLGWGLGGFESAYKVFRPPLTDELAQYQKMTAFAHNEFLQVAVELGLFGLLSFLWLVSTIAVTGFISLRNASQKDWTRVAALAVILSLLIHALFDFNLHLPIVFLILVTMAVALLKTEPHRFRNFNFFGSKYFFGVLAGVWVAGISLVLASEACSRLGDSQREKNFPVAARDFYKIAFYSNPLNEETAKKYAALSPVLEKEKILKQAIRFNPGEDELHAQLARAFLSRLKVQEAINEFHLAIRFHPKHPFYYTEIGDLYIIQNRLNIALALYRKAIELEPFYMFAHYRLGELYLAQKEKKLARMAFDNVVKIGESNLAQDSEYARSLLSFDSSLARKKLRGLK